MCQVPQEIKHVPFDLAKLKKIAGGGNHALFLIDDGRTFGCGWNNRCQLGIQQRKNISTITNITLESSEMADEIIDVACGWDSSAVIDINGSIFVWGSNTFGQIGLPTEKVKYTHRPYRLRLPEDKKARDIAFGLRFLAIRTVDNCIYFVGRIKTIEFNCTLVEWRGCYFWQLRIDDATVKNLKSIASGQNHFIYDVIGEDGTMVYGFGDNKFNQIASIQLPGYVTSLRSGWTHNGAISHGSIYLWGRNTYGQLGTAETTYSGVNTVRCEDSDVVELYLGAEHGTAISQNGAVYTWGWNEHGNCGNGMVENV